MNRFNGESIQSPIELILQLFFPISVVLISILSSAGFDGSTSSRDSSGQVDVPHYAGRPTPVRLRVKPEVHIVHIFLSDSEDHGRARA